MGVVLRAYLRTSLLVRVLAGFIGGAILGVVLHGIGGDPNAAERVVPYVQPFGAIFVHMLKMIVVPVVFFSLVAGAASLPMRKFGRVGLKTIGWYLGTSLVAAVLGVALALTIQPGGGIAPEQWRAMGAQQAAEEQVAAPDTANPLLELLLNLFRNPFQALAEGNYLPIIVFAILFGLALRVTLESRESNGGHAPFERLNEWFTAIRDTLFRIVDWILEYSPIGVLALSIVNFGLYGPSIFGTYLRIAGGVIAGILVMVFVVYPLILWFVTRKNPYAFHRRAQEAMIMAFVTRSSAATLPVSMAVAQHDLKVREELTGFSLPLGATINMDGVCIHLPMFAVLSAYMFGLDLSAGDLLLFVLLTVLASVGAGGVPGGSLMLLFVILQNLQLSPDQVAMVVGIALGINPILDMFETMNNVTGDLFCTYSVAHSEKLLDADEQAAG